jgi:hypothetical protein
MKSIKYAICTECGKMIASGSLCPCHKDHSGYIHQLQYSGEERVNGLKESDYPEVKPSERQVGGSHYKDYPIEPGHYSQVNKLGFMEGNVVKYVTRHSADGGVEDIDTAIHCLELIKEWVYEGKE